MASLMTAQTNGPPSDELSLTQEAATNPEAFAELYRRHLRAVYRYHLVHTADVKDAEDLTSQTFLAALEGLRGFRGEGSFAAWLMGIASRKRAQLFRGRRPQVTLEALHELPSDDPPTDQAALQRLQMQSAARALRQINRQRAEAIILCAFAGLSCAEAGDILHKSEAAVKMLVARGLQELRERTSLSLEVE